MIWTLNCREITVLPPKMLLQSILTRQGIPTTLYVPQGSHYDYLANTRSSNDDNPFAEERIVKSSESVVLPELTPHVFLSNIMRISSNVDCQYMPLVSVDPISVALASSNTILGTITNTSTAYINYVNNQAARATMVISVY